MNRNRWLIAFLLTSWTLNVALGVALFLSSRYPEGGFWTGGSMDQMPLGGPMGPMMPGMFKHDSELYNRSNEFCDSQHNLMLEMADALAEDDLDSNRIMILVDSLDQVRSQLHRMQIKHLMTLHGQIPPQARDELVPRVMRRMENRGARFRHRGWRGKDRDCPRRP